MISQEEHIEIRRLHLTEGFTVNAISKHMNRHPDAIKKAIEQHQFGGQSKTKSRKIDPYVPFILETLEDFPKITATRLFQMIKSRGYPGGVRQIRRFIRKNRPRHKKAYLSISVLPGEQGQVDWGSFGSLKIGDAIRKLSCFVLVLSYSRYMYAEFTFDQTLESFLRCHTRAFEAMGGIARKLLYDNLKACVVERMGPYIKYNPSILDLSAFYNFKPFACNVASGWEKGRVERSIRYIRDNFFTARKIKSLADANEQMQTWLAETANVRPWPDNDSFTVGQKLTEELPYLLKLPASPLLVKHVRQARSGKTPYLRFDLNNYSIPPKFVGKMLTIEADESQVRILEQDQEVAIHPRSFDKGHKIEIKAHIDELLERKPRAKMPKGRDRILAAVPEADAWFKEVAKLGQSSIGGSVSRLLTLLDQYGQEGLQIAIIEAIKDGIYKPYGIESILLRNRRLQKSNVPTSISLPDDSRVKGQVIQRTSLGKYDSLQKGAKDE